MRYTMADLVYFWTGDDVNALSARTYRAYVHEVLQLTTEAEREAFYRTGDLPASLR